MFVAHIKIGITLGIFSDRMCKFHYYLVFIENYQRCIKYWNNQSTYVPRHRANLVLVSDGELTIYSA